MATHDDAVEIGENTGDEASEERRGLPSDQIDTTFVPTPRPSVVQREFDGELVLLDTDTSALHTLNPTSAVVWQCFDGEVSLSELAEELSEAFGEDRETIEADILYLTQALGRFGLLEGVEPQEPESVEANPEGVPVGDELAPFATRKLGGGRFDLTELRGRKVLLVNWSPFCTYCEAIATELGAVAPKLADRDVELVLLSFDEDDENQEMLDEHGLKAIVAMQYEDDDESDEAKAFQHPFPDMGTPVAYLLDEQGRVAERLAYGATEVPSLARRTAGLSDRMISSPADPVLDAPAEMPELDDRYLPMDASSGVCAPSASGGPSRGSGVVTWQPTQAYRLGQYHVGIRGNSPGTDGLIARALAEYRVPEDTGALPNFSVKVPTASPTGARGLNMLLFGNQTLVRTRSLRRLLLAMPNFLSGVAGWPPMPGVFAVSATPALFEGKGILLPIVAMGQWLEEIQPRLARAGIYLIDTPKAWVDPVTAELVVPEPVVRLTPEVLDDLPEERVSRAEGPPIPAGRYPLGLWALWQPFQYHETTPIIVHPDDQHLIDDHDHEEEEYDDLKPLSRAVAISHALWLVSGEGAAVDRLEMLGSLFERVPAVAVFGYNGDDFVKNLLDQMGPVLGAPATA